MTTQDHMLRIRQLELLGDYTARSSADWERIYKHIFQVARAHRLTADPSRV